MSQNLLSAAVVIGALKVKVHDRNLVYIVVSRISHWHTVTATLCDSHEGSVCMNRLRQIFDDHDVQ